MISESRLVDHLYRVLQPVIPADRTDHRRERAFSKFVPDVVVCVQAIARWALRRQAEYVPEVIDGADVRMPAPRAQAKLVAVAQNG